MLGAALVAAIVSSVAGAWGLAEVFGWKHTLNERPSRQTAKFYLTYALAHLAGAVLVLAEHEPGQPEHRRDDHECDAAPDRARVPAHLEARALPEEWRMRGLRKYSTWGLCALVMGFGLYMIPATLHWL